MIGFPPLLLSCRLVLKRKSVRRVWRVNDDIMMMSKDSSCTFLRICTCFQEFFRCSRFCLNEKGSAVHHDTVTRAVILQGVKAEYESKKLYDYDKNLREVGTYWILLQSTDMSETFHRFLTASITLNALHKWVKIRMNEWTESRIK